MMRQFIIILTTLSELQFELIEDVLKVICLCGHKLVINEAH